jgi:hypothetical protein
MLNEALFGQKRQPSQGDGTPGFEGDNKHEPVSNEDCERAKARLLQIVDWIGPMRTFYVYWVLDCYC